MTQAQDDQEADGVQDAVECARYLKALGDPLRLQMVRALQSGPKTVSDISLLLDLEMSNVSHHLRVLYHAGLVSTERDGKFIYYSLNKDLVKSRAVPTGRFDFGCCRLDLEAQ